MTNDRSDEPADEQDTEPEPVEGTVLDSFDEVKARIEEWADGSPPGAMYRTRDIPLTGGRILVEMEEVLPGDDPDERRRITVESGAMRETDYDVAVTFAGEDRTYVHDVVEHLVAQGAKVYYDKNEEAMLWGRNQLEEFSETYRGRAFRVLMFVSESYARKEWPTVERRTAQERAMRDMDEPYILPVRLDDTDVPGLLSTTAYVDGRKKTAVEIAELTLDHLRASSRRVAPPLIEREMALRVSVRATAERMAGGHWEVLYRVQNGGDYPISNVVVVVDDPGAEGRAEDQDGTAIEVVLGTLAAGEIAEGRAEDVHFTREPYFGEHTTLGVILFTDHWKNNWATGRDTLELKSHPPRVC